MKSGLRGCGMESVACTLCPPLRVMMQRRVINNDCMTLLYLRVIVMLPTPKLYLDAGASPYGLLRCGIGMLGEPLGDQEAEGLFHKIIFLATVL